MANAACKVPKPRGWWLGPWSAQEDPCRGPRAFRPSSRRPHPLGRSPICTKREKVYVKAALQGHRPDPARHKPTAVAPGGPGMNTA